MKLFSKIAVIAAACMLVSVFTACKTEEEESGPGIVAEFKGTIPSIPSTNIRSIDKMPVFDITAYFYDDDSFEATGNYKWADDDKIVYEGDFAKGTYTGDPSKDGKIKLTLTSTYNGSGLKEIPKENQEADEITIIDGTFVIADLEFPIVFKRVE